MNREEMRYKSVTDWVVRAGAIVGDRTKKASDAKKRRRKLQRTSKRIRRKGLS